MVALATSFHPVGCLVLWAHLSCLVLSCLVLSCLVLSCLLLSSLVALLFSSLAIGFFSYWRVRLRDRGGAAALRVFSPHSALRPPLFLSSSFFIFICQASSSLALIAPSPLDLRCSRLAPTLCSIALDPRSSVFPCTLRPRFAVLVCFCLAL